jgi:ribosome-associated protein
MIAVNDNIVIEEREIEERFVRASGPGGQNVNKLATAVQIRFDAMASPNLDEATKVRLGRRAGRRMTAEGVIVIIAQRFRTQEANRRDARNRLAALIRAAAVAPKPRRPTRPSAGARRQRLDDKKRRGQIKALRSGSHGEE